MITLIDYGLGNVRAFSNVYKRLGIPIVIAKCADDLNAASKLILPGVGAFDHAMQQFNATGMRETITNMVLQEEIPILGICVGMQMLASSSDEGTLPGLSWVSGSVKKLKYQTTTSDIRLPHMGWNNLSLEKHHPLFSNLTTSAWFYFLHSYYFECDNPKDVLAKSEYGQAFACAINSKNIYGVQFHPEKSQHYGAQLLKNFAEL